MGSRSGTCHICGANGQLSYEHVPPRAAFNDRPVIARLIDEIVRQGSIAGGRGHISQRGAGAHTLCRQCNSLTGHWYGKSYVDWVAQGMQILGAARCAPSLYYNFHVLPLRVIKQITCMFFSVNGTRFRQVHPELEKFVLDRNRRHLPHNVRVYTFYAVGNFFRHSSVSGLINITNTSKTSIFSEITFPPFGYVMAFGRPPEGAMLDISYFSSFDYNTYRPMTLRIPVLPVVTYIPGDYRTQSEIDEALSSTEQQDQLL